MTKKEKINNISTHISLLWFLTISYLVSYLASSDLNIIFIILLVIPLILRDVVLGKSLAKIFSDSAQSLTLSLVLTYITTLALSIIFAFFNNRNSEGILVHCTDCCGCPEITLQELIPNMAFFTIFPFAAIIISAYVFYFSSKIKKKTPPSNSKILHP